MRRLFVFAIVLSLAVAGASQAVLTQLTSTTRGGFLNLDCTWVPNTSAPGALDFTFTLTNFAANNPIDNTPTTIRGFTLEFPSTLVSISNPADFAINSWALPGNVPLGWEVHADTVANSLKWDTHNPVFDIQPGGDFRTFGFTAFWTPAAQTTSAAGIDGAAYSGFTCGPGAVIPEASSVMLALMGLSSIVGFRKLYSR